MVQGRASQWAETPVKQEILQQGAGPGWRQAKERGLINPQPVSKCTQLLWQKPIPQPTNKTSGQPCSWQYNDTIKPPQCFAT